MFAKDSKEETKDISFEFRRGFPSKITCSQADWLKHGPEIVLAAPIEEVVLSDVFPHVREYGAGDDRDTWYRHDCPDDDWWEALLDVSGVEKWQRQPNINFLEFGNNNEAKPAWNATALLWARDKAGLPRLEER